MKNEDADYKRHVRIWKFLKWAGYPFFRLTYGYSCEQAPHIKPPYLVVANHNCDLDPVLVGFSFPQQMYFLASEHVYRRGFVSKILKWAFSPIAKIKGASDTLAVMKMIRTLRSGKNVCMFPEGNRSFNGVSGLINETTGKLIKTSAATLVTYKLEGAYMTTPRWGFGIRKGKLFGHIVNIYTPEQLKEMTPLQVTEIVRKDTFEDAYKVQKEKQISYIGKNVAEGFEYSYCVCPECKEIGTIASKKNDIFCTKCGKRSSFDDKGFLHGDFPFNTVYEWDCWQENFYESFTQTAEGTFFADKNVALRIINSEHEEKLVGIGELSMNKEKIIFTTEQNETNVELLKIPDMSIYGKSGLQFTDDAGVHYELLPAVKGTFYNARKYLSCWKKITGKK